MAHLRIKGNGLFMESFRTSSEKRRAELDERNAELLEENAELQERLEALEKLVSESLGVNLDEGGKK
jgi:DNA-binding transcriptional MerR regulator